jgi:hypothetical protein
MRADGRDQIPKLRTRVRFPSPAPRMTAGTAVVLARASGALLVLAGPYVAWYGWFQLRVLGRLHHRRPGRRRRERSAVRRRPGLSRPPAQPEIAAGALAATCRPSCKRQLSASPTRCR